MVEMGRNLTRVKKRGTQYWDYLIANNNRKNFLDSIYVPANTGVKLRSVAMMNALKYDGGNGPTSYSTNHQPWLYAKSGTGQGWNGGRHVSGSSDWSGNVDHRTDTNVDLFRSSTQAQGKLFEGFVETVAHTNACIGAFETKDLTIAAQTESYTLIFGYIFNGNSGQNSGMQAKDIQVIMSNIHPRANAHSLSYGKKIGSRSAFNTGKKRISGRI